MRNLPKKSVRFMIPLVEIFTCVDDLYKIFKAKIHGVVTENSYKKRRNRCIRMSLMSGYKTFKDTTVFN